MTYYGSMRMSGGCGRRRLQVTCADIRRWLRMGAAYCTEPVGRRMRCLKSFIFNRQRAGQAKPAEAQKRPESRENQENSYGSRHLQESAKGLHQWNFRRRGRANSYQDLWCEHSPGILHMCAQICTRFRSEFD